MSTDYRTRFTISVLHNGEIIFSDSGMGAPDTFQRPAVRDYTLKYARILNPDIPTDAPVVIREESKYGHSELPAILRDLHPNHEYLRGWVAEHFGESKIRVRASF